MSQRNEEEQAMLTATRIVHSSLLLDFGGGDRILTDPWFSEKPGYYHGEPLGMTVGDLPDLSGVVVSHAHYDHYDMNAFSSYRNKKVPFVVKKGTAQPAVNVGFKNVTELEPWESTMVGNVKVTASPAKHGVPENTYILECRGQTAFFGGDTLLIPELEEVARRFPKIDLALLPVNGLILRPLLYRRVVMDDTEAAKLCGILRPRVAVPTHYAFTAGNLRNHLLLKYTGTAKGFIESVPKYSKTTTAKILDPGRSVEIEPASRDE
ncbi:MAG: MBL fold metallo-hydrolase [Nitrososphaerales archaeon]